MTTEYTQVGLEFQPLKNRDSGRSSTAGRSAVTAVVCCFGKSEKRTRILHQFASCFTDYRNPDLIEHTVKELAGAAVSMVWPWL